MSPQAKKDVPMTIRPPANVDSIASNAQREEILSRGDYNVKLYQVRLLGRILRLTPILWSGHPERGRITRRSIRLKSETRT